MDRKTMHKAIDTAEIIMEASADLAASYVISSIRIPTDNMLLKILFEIGKASLGIAVGCAAAQMLRSWKEEVKQNADTFLVILAN